MNLETDTPCVATDRHNVVEHAVRTRSDGVPTQYRFCARCGAEWFLEQRDGVWVVAAHVGPQEDAEEDEDEFGACQGGFGQEGDDD